MAKTSKQRDPGLQLILEMLESLKVPEIRPMRVFAEEEIRLPSGGPYSGLPFRIHRQPVAGLYFDACDALDEHGRPVHRRRAATGPAQDGKTFACFNVPILFHLFEIKENVILGAPTMEMARDKWSMDLLPMIKATRYRELLPTRGAGSKGGEFERIDFTNGASLKLMSARGGDEKRSGFTSRVVGITEADKMDTAGEASREADPVSQMEARSNAFDDRALLYIECTISIEEGRINQEISERGTNSRIMLPCPHCLEHVDLGREHLVGWQDAPNIIEARDRSHFCCPACGAAWTEEQRFEAVRMAVLLHEGQEVDKAGRITGEPKPTDTLGFRWSAAHSLLKSAGRVGTQEWQSVQAEDSENAEREMRQFWWALPIENPEQNMVDLSVNGIISRTVPEWRRGIVPAATEYLTMGEDVGKYMIHWVLLADGAGMNPHVVDFGIQPTEASVLGAEEGVKLALLQLHDRSEEGWETEDGDTLFVPDQVWVDARYLMRKAVYPFIRQVDQSRYVPTLGYGAGQLKLKKYIAPRTRNKAVREIGDHYHIIREGREHGRISVARVDANAAKAAVHERLGIPLRDEKGGRLDPRPDDALTLFGVDRQNELLDFGKHILAERQIAKFVEGRGMQMVFHQFRDANHWLDALALALVAQERRRRGVAVQPQAGYFEQQAALTRAGRGA